MNPIAKTKSLWRWRDLCDETFLVNVLESMNEAVAVVNAEGTIVYVNPAYERELNVKFKDIIGKKIQDIAPESVILKCLRSGKSVIRQPSRVLRLGIDIVVSATPIFKDGKLIGATSVFNNVTEIKRLNQELERVKHFSNYLQEQLDTKSYQAKGFENIIGNNKNFQDAVSRAIKASKSDITVLITGETGTGKDIIAKAIHDASIRNQNPFIQINCAAIPENLLESELFGYEEGAFTGARRGGKPGKFELAHKGTIFLDEIGDMSLILQAKLLKILQEKCFERVGGTKTIRVDVRIIAATNQNLEIKRNEHNFRDDLFYRLSVFNLKIIPLRSRRDDIPFLISHFLKKFSLIEEKYLKISSSVMKLLLSYDWPGNVRELQNVMESAVVSCNSGCVELTDIPEYLSNLIEIQKNSNKDIFQQWKPMNLETQISSLEKDQILKALENAGNNRSKAIRMLGISRSTFYERLAKYGLLK